MPYVPGFLQDIFISYASEDRAWVEEFRTLLYDAMIERGLEAEIWRDRDNIRFGQNWKSEMYKAIENTALFLAILSPNYRQSDYCNDESDYFQDLRDKNRDMKVGEQELYRYLKVIKTAWDNDSHRRLLPDLQDIEFYMREPKQRIDSPLAFTSQEFASRIRAVAHALEAALKGLRRLREMVYVASPAADVEGDWKALRAELSHQGYVVGPAAKLNRGLDSEFIRGELQGAALTIHLLGADHHPLAETQLKVAAESGQRMAIWIRKGADEVAGEAQRKLLNAVRDYSWIPKTASLIDGAAGRVPIADLLELLKPSAQAGPAGGTRDGRPTVYLICDPTVDQDRDFAFSLERSIEEKEKMRVVLPERDSNSARERHQQLLRECDGVLLYRDQAPEPWFFQYFSDVARAEKLLKRPPIASKAILASEEDLTDFPAPASVKLIGRQNPFSLDSLEPFLAPLRVSALGVAHAGD